jgi:LAS superfamily LD-carboxypeptidase LdcB
MDCRAGINTAMQDYPHSDNHPIGSYLTGSTQTHLVEWVGAPLQSATANYFLVHSDVVEPLTALSQRAAGQGFELRLCSSFRSFERQLKIWNDKIKGLRPVYDDRGAQLDMAELSEWQQVQAVMRWSALPGASRHHWGTDFDIYDAAAVAPDYQVKLIPEEVENGGPFAPMHNWLDTVFGSGIGGSGAAGSDFYRPYAEDRGGIAPERWHISYRPLADVFAAQLTVDLLARKLSTADLELKETVLAHLDELYARYIHVPH